MPASEHKRPADNDDRLFANIAKVIKSRKFGNVGSGRVSVCHISFLICSNAAYKVKPACKRSGAIVVQRGRL